MEKEIVKRDWLRRARINKNHTLKSLAEVTGVSAPFICLVEQGKKTPSGRVAKLLAKELGLPLEKFWP